MTQVRGAFFPVTSLPYEAPLDIQERGGDATVEVLSLVHDMSDSQGKHTKRSFLEFWFSRPVFVR